MQRAGVHQWVDAGEPVLAGRVEFFAKVEIILLSIPQIRAILQIAGELAG